MPARINLINPLNAVEGDFWIPSVAINRKFNPLSAFCYIKKVVRVSILKVFKVRKTDYNYSFELQSEEKLSKKESDIKHKIKTQNKLI